MNFNYIAWVFLLLVPMAHAESVSSLQKIQDEFVQNGFENVNVTAIDMSQYYTTEDRQQASHYIHLSFLLFRNTTWTREQVNSHLKAIVATYNQAPCRLLIQHVILVEADPYQNHIAVDWASVFPKPKEAGIDLLIAKQIPASLPRPLFALMKDSHQGLSAWASASMRVGTKSPLVNTAWIMSKVNSNSYLRNLPDRYDPLAHELAHLLINAGHNDYVENNILHDDMTKVNDQILPEQCEQIKNSNIVYEVTNI